MYISVWSYVLLCQMVTELNPGDDHAFVLRGIARHQKRVPGMKLKNDDFRAVIKVLRLGCLCPLPYKPPPWGGCTSYIYIYIT